ncbi:hypothetical protein AB835_11470 [Candidatus Endobugula sertula]|uniref:DUF4166 domain-containing protein n=1 Tax=Candidatus Endobugula sertula TaxID=62101 RepID=A0A1D2QN25_9GAMM|nr:hypothetical protein AB835_11470 [Candidatus Endobugula sertula]
MTLGTHLDWCKQAIYHEIEKLAAHFPDTVFHFTEGNANNSTYLKSNDQCFKLAYINYERYLPEYDFVVHHGGAGILYYCLQYAKPSIVLPQDCDQFDHAARLYDGNDFFHGKDALQFMARYGDNCGVFNLTNKVFYWSDTIATVTYPWLRGVRNTLLRFRKVGRIDNVALKNEPIFKSIFGDTWGDLPLVMQKHYSNRPYSDDVTQVEGFLDVMCKPPLTYLSPLMKIMGQIPMRNETAVPVTVYFESDENTKSLHFNRIFRFKGQKPYLFHSRMLQLKDNQVIEIMRFGLCWKMRYSWDGQKVILKHDGYALSLFGHFIPIPLTLLIGNGYAEEIPIDDNTFSMVTHITHSLWGKLYEYKGQFVIEADG